MGAEVEMFLFGIACFFLLLQMFATISNVSEQLVRFISQSFSRAVAAAACIHCQRYICCAAERVANL